MESSKHFGNGLGRDELSWSAARERAVTLTRLIWSERRWLLRCAATGCLVAILIAFLIPKEYESTTSLLPPDNRPDFGGLQMNAQLAGLTALAGSVLGMKSPAAQLVGVLQSRLIQDRLVARFNLQKVYRDRYIEDARKDLDRNTTVSLDRKTEIISVTVRDHDRYRAAQMAAAYIDELDKAIGSLNTSSPHRQRVFLEEHLKNVEESLMTAERDFSAFASKNTAIDIKEQGKAMVESVAILQGQLVAAQTELQGLKQAYADNNIRVRSAQARVAELRKELIKLGGNPDGSSASDALYPSIRQLPVLGVTYADLFRRVKVDETVFELLTQAYEMAKVEEAKSIPSIKVLDPATVPERKAFPPRGLITFLGTVMAFILGLCYLVLRKIWRELDPSRPEKALLSEIVDSVAYKWGKFRHADEQVPTEVASREEETNEVTIEVGARRQRSR